MTRRLCNANPRTRRGERLLLSDALPTTNCIDGTTMVEVPTEDVRHHYDGLLLSFPTEKAGLNDLTAKDRERLTDFVTNKARAIAALAGSGFVVSP